MDEAQLEEKIKNYEFKFFDTKEKANAYRLSMKKQKSWSEPILGKDGRYVLGYSEACGLIDVAVDMVNKHYKLNVPLTAGYILGRSWKDCH